MGSSFSRTSFDPVRDTQDLKGKVIVVTGGNHGIGYGTIQHLARKGAKVYMAARTESKATGAIASMENEGLAPGHGEVVWLKLDLSDPRSAQSAAEEFIKREKRLDVLINNAGLMMEAYQKTDDGILDIMAVNHFGHFVFTLTLLPVLKQTAQEPNSDVRIVVVGSHLHKVADKNITFRTVDDFNETYSKSLIPRFKRYANSKLTSSLFANELQRRLDAQSPDGASPIVVMTVHPGIVNTFSHRMPLPRAITDPIMNIFFFTTIEGSYTSTIAAASPDVRANPGKYRGAYLQPIGVIGRASAQARNQELAKELWMTTQNWLNDLGITGLFV